MDEKLQQKLQALAQKYEVASFVDQDPSQFLRWYKAPADVECAAFVAAMLSFGSRTQFIPKIKQIFELADTWCKKNAEPLSFTRWLLAGSPDFPTGNQKFYRFYSYTDMHALFTTLADILRQSGSFGNYLKKKWEGEVSPSLQPARLSSATLSSGDTPQRPAVMENGTLLSKSAKLSGKNDSLSCKTAASPSQPAAFENYHLSTIISARFPNAAIVPKGKNSANKRVHMFLRWMVRQNSPVDLGLWTWYSPENLLIPLDVHVMQEAVGLGLLPQNARATFQTAQNLTKAMAQVFPGDPARADYALFGLGVSD